MWQYDIFKDVELWTYNYNWSCRAESISTFHCSNKRTDTRNLKNLSCVSRNYCKTFCSEWKMSVFIRRHIGERTTVILLRTPAFIRDFLRRGFNRAIFRTTTYLQFRHILHGLRDTNIENRRVDNVHIRDRCQHRLYRLHFDF